MQNRYAGDIGDFGKFGLLRALRGSGLSIGVNWYLVPDETRIGDGPIPAGTCPGLSTALRKRCESPFLVFNLQGKHEAA